jgi:hypothetical protein
LSWLWLILSLLLIVSFGLWVVVLLLWLVSVVLYVRVIVHRPWALYCTWFLVGWLVVVHDLRLLRSCVMCGWAFVGVCHCFCLCNDLQYLCFHLIWLNV